MIIALKFRVSTLFFKKKIVLIIFVFSGPVTGGPKWVKDMSEWSEIFCGRSGAQALYPRTVPSFPEQSQKFGIFRGRFGIKSYQSIRSS